jgi:arylformamidase
MREPTRIIDISQPIRESSACFPGDTAFSSKLTVSYQDSQVINLSAFTMSPHVGTHADAPIHVRGSFPNERESAGTLPLSPFIGPAAVVDISPWTQGIRWSQIASSLEQIERKFCGFPKRLLFKTAQHIRYDTFEKEYAWFCPQLVPELAKRGIQLVGIDTPSVDAIDSKTLETHHALLETGIFWLENLDLTTLIMPATPVEYFLIAAPLKLMELEASPVRAVLLEFS